MFAQIDAPTPLPQTATLSVEVSDDGRPGPRKPRGTTRRLGDQADAKEPLTAITGLPSRNRQAGPTTQDRVLAKNAYETGLAVTWLQYRGRGIVTFDPMTIPIRPAGAALSGKATTTASFSEPGEYVIRAVADDGHYTGGANVTVIVRDAPSAPSSVQH